MLHDDIHHSPWHDTHMPSRRQFLLTAASLLAAPALTAHARRSTTTPDLPEGFDGLAVFQRLLARADAQQWRDLPIGDLIGRIALELKDTPYVAHTLELDPNREFCTVNLTGLDCVTFFESTLGFARMLKTGGQTPADLVRQVTFTRYRGGRIDGYPSRLHYTTDWVHDNVLKGVVADLTPTLPGAAPFTQQVGFMSAKPENYRQLVQNPALVETVRQQEAALNARPKSFVPMDALSAAEPHLRTGDIVGLTTTIDGIDISHTGLVIVSDTGTRQFMDASSQKDVMKVILRPGPLHQSIASRTTTGAIFARPLEPTSLP